MSFWSNTLDWLTGGDTDFSTVLDSVDWQGVGSLGGSYFLNKSGFANSDAPQTGYQGGIPRYTAVRERVADTYNPDRRPGSSGQRYFTDTQYVDSSAPINSAVANDAAGDIVAEIEAAETGTATDISANETPEQIKARKKQARIDARKARIAERQAAQGLADDSQDPISDGDSQDPTIDDGSQVPTETNLSAIDAVRQIAGRQAEYLRDQNLFNPAMESNPAPLQFAPVPEQTQGLEGFVPQYNRGGEIEDDMLFVDEMDPAIMDPRVARRDARDARRVARDQERAMQQDARRLERDTRNAARAQEDAARDQRLAGIASLNQDRRDANRQANQLKNYDRNRARISSRIGSMENSLNTYGSADEFYQGRLERQRTGYGSTLPDSYFLNPANRYNTFLNSAEGEAQSKQIYNQMPQELDRLRSAYASLSPPQGQGLAEFVPQYAQGGIANLAGGRYLDGATDGMADKVPANIDGQQPAALSDGEFVVPADVVSHLGNGNSNAGVMQLYAMMDNVRKARTGNPKQGKQINPAQYMPGMRA